jgi:hypothetical protein
MKEDIRTGTNRVAGLLFAVINLVWIAHSAYFSIAYRIRKPVLWFMRTPDWILIVNAALGFIGLYACLRVFHNRLPIKTFLFIEAFLLLTGYCLHIY